MMRNRYFFSNNRSNASGSLKFNFFKRLRRHIFNSLNLYKAIQEQSKAFSSSLAKLIILNETEKDIGPVDDFLYFALLFIKFPIK